jgi:hypothetical protein
MPIPNPLQLMPQADCYKRILLIFAAKKETPA